MAYSLRSGLDVLRYLSTCDQPASVTQIREATGLPRATAYRTLDDLAAAGWISESDSPKRYCLTWTAAGIGLQRLARVPVRETTFRSLLGLARETHHTALFSLFDGGQTIWIEAVESVGDQPRTRALFSVAPAVLTASGRAALSVLPESYTDELLEQEIPKVTEFTITDPVAIRAEIAKTRNRGFGMSVWEWSPGTSFGAPVLDRHGKPAACIGITVPGARFDESETRRLGDIVRRWARTASIDFGYRSTSLFG